MQKLSTKLTGPVLLAPAVRGDEQGFFLESYRRGALSEYDIEDEFVQDNHPRSSRWIVRGMHYQPGQAKLIRCVRGSVFDVLVDIRPDSPQFGDWEGFVLDDVGHHQLYCPDGFAHGFCVLSEIADVAYKVSTFYDPLTESGFGFDDPEVGIEWPDRDQLVASERDRTAPTLAQRASSTSFVHAADA
jgi:dTDP-4-dehydrorhamnose 3,5-epimerase